MLLAQSFDAIQAKGLPGNNIPTGSGAFGKLIIVILPYIYYGAGIVLLVYMVMGGLQLMTSRGDPKGVQAAQTKITNGLIGFVVILFSTIIVSVIGNVFGITIFRDIFK